MSDQSKNQLKSPKPMPINPRFSSPIKNKTLINYKKSKSPNVYSRRLSIPGQFAIWACLAFALLWLIDWNVALLMQWMIYNNFFYDIVANSIANYNVDHILRFLIYFQFCNNDPFRFLLLSLAMYNNYFMDVTIFGFYLTLIYHSLFLFLNLIWIRFWQVCF